MRIGLVSYEYPPQHGLGGVGTYTFRLAGALGRAGCEVVVVTGPSDQPEIVQENVRVHRVSALYEPPLRWRAARFVYWNIVSRLMDRANPLVWHWLRWDLASAPALCAIDDLTPLDVIEAPEHAANGLLAARKHRWPLIVRTHGPWDLFFAINRTGGSALNRLLANLERQSAALATLVTSPSRTMAELMQMRWGLPRRPDVIPNFMDVPAAPASLPPADGPQRILCAGRIERFKGQDALVKAFVRIAARHPRAQLVLLGPDQWSSKTTFAKLVDGWAADQTIRRRIILAGRVSLQQVQDELAAATIAVISSTGFESFSYSTLEAMAAARPIIACRVGAIPELLDHGRCGLLVSPGNVRQLAEAMDLLLGDRSLLQRLAYLAHARALGRYDTRVALPLFLSAYEKARRKFRLGR